MFKVKYTILRYTKQLCPILVAEMSTALLYSGRKTDTKKKSQKETGKKPAATISDKSHLILELSSCTNCAQQVKPNSTAVKYFNFKPSSRQKITTSKGETILMASSLADSAVSSTSHGPPSSKPESMCKDSKLEATVCLSGSKGIPKSKNKRQRVSSSGTPPKNSREKSRKFQQSCQEMENKKRSWHQLEPSPVGSKPGIEFTVMSYNILAQDLAEMHLDLYSQCHHQHLKWNKRGPALLQQIIDHNADVVCLQEVQGNHWKHYLRPTLNSHGYFGVYTKRSGYDKVDGCAILFKHSKFSLVQCKQVQFNQGGILDRDNVGVILLLQPNRRVYGDMPKLCVATTHLLFNPRRGDVKLAQLMLFLAEIDKLAALDGFNKWNIRENSETKCESVNSNIRVKNQEQNSKGNNHLPSQEYYPIILCGDFNTEPFSNMYQFITEGYLKYSGLISRLICGQSEGQKGGGNVSISPCLLPDHLAITESCQFASVLHERHLRWQRALLSKGSWHKIDRQNKDISNDKGKRTHKVREEQESSAQSAEKDNDVSMTSKDKTKSREGIGGVQQLAIDRIKIESDANVSEMKAQVKESGAYLSEPMTTACDSRQSHPGHGDDQFQCPNINSGKAYHAMGFKSVYSHLITNVGSQDEVLQEVTSKHNKCCCTLDYIFYSNIQRQSVSDNGGYYSSYTDFAGTSDDHGSHIDSKRPNETCVNKKNVLSSQSHRLTSEPIEKTRYKKKSPKFKRVGHLQLLARYSLPSGEEVAETGHLPNLTFPSDHLCLIAKFFLSCEVW